MCLVVCPPMDFALRMIPGGAGGAVAGCPSASGSRRLGWAVKLPETPVSTCERPPSLAYESVTPWADVIDPDWPASSVPDAPVEPELASDELPVTAGTSVVPTMVVTAPMPDDGTPATGRSRTPDPVG